MSDFKVFLEKLGYLHDAVVLSLVWDPEVKTLEFRLKDIYNNFKGLPEYPGTKPGSVILHGIENIHIDVEPTDKHLNVYEFVVENKGGNRWTASVSFWPGGKITASYTRAEFPTSDVMSAPGPHS